MNNLSASACDDFANKIINSAVTDRAEDKVNFTQHSGAETDQPLLVRKHISCLVCRDCDLNFNTYFEFKHHLLKHVKLPSVIVQRLNPSYVRRIILNKPLRSPHKGRRHNFARKRTRSYIVPKVNQKKAEPLKLTLKLATDATTEQPSFEVVPRKILVGPGDTYPANGGVLDVKTEVITQSEDVEWESRSVEGEGEKESETGERTSESALEENKNSGVNNAESVGQDEGEEKSKGDKVTEDNFREEEQSERGGNTEDHSRGFASACPSPTPSEQLRPEFLAPEGGDEEDEDEDVDEDDDQDCDNPPSPTMVEVGGSAVGEAGSPAFPTTSPAPPPSGDSNSQHSLPDQSHQSSPVDNQPDDTDGHNSNHATESDETALPRETDSFNWNDVGNVTSGNGDDPSLNASALEERDPLMLPDQPSTEPGQENDESDNISGTSSDSLLRGFLCDPAGGDKAIAVTTPASGVGNVMDGLGSEYISLERLGETGAVACCDVCGEQTSNLQEHRARAGHYKCSHSECGNQVFPNLNELAGHQHIAHGGQPPPPPQSQATPQQTQPQPPQPSSQPYPMPPPPVQQLAQQVQRLPIPPSHQMNHHPQQQPMVQQMSPQLHQLMPAQQQYPQSAVRRPPPLYRVPGSANMPGSPGNVQYPNQQQQHMMPPQMYNQQSYSQQQNNFSGPSGPMTPPRPYGNMVQQMNRPRAPTQQGMQRPLVQQQQQQQQMQQQPRMTMQQKRQAVVSGSPGSSPNKQRRMDVLIPDRHDDADCHVIAMQKRTDSGPVIGNVQGAANNSGRPESMIHLTDSITLSVRQPQGGNNSNPAVAAGGKNKSDAKAVANILATRGITVTPAGGTGGRNTTQQSPQQQLRQARPPPPPPAQPAPPVTTLNLNSAISIIAQPTASSSRQQQGNFAVPHGRGSPSRAQQQIERPPRPPTVDLTGDGPPPPPLMHSVSRGRGRGRGLMGRHTCQVCDKAFSTQESLNQHMALHRSPGKLPYRCSLCSAQYPTQQGLLQHRQAYHKEPAIQPGAELAVPVVDLKAQGAISRLAGLGIHHYIPLSQLGSQAGGYFGLPIISVEGTRNPGICNLGALGAASVLSLGPLKHLGR